MGKKSSNLKRKIVIVFFSTLILITVIILILYFLLYPWKLTLLDDSSKVTYVNQYEDYSAVISEDGDCYVQSGRCGIEDTDQYFRLRNIFKADSYVKIYDGDDAKIVRMSDSGGVIITNNNDLYVFSNNYYNFITPKMFKHGITNAFITDNLVYVIENNKFGCYDLSIPSTLQNFEYICSDVVDFQITEYGNEVIVLTKDNTLSVLKKTDNGYAFIKLFDDIKSFSVVQGNLNGAAYNMLGIVKTDGTAWYGYCTVNMFREADLTVTKLTDEDMRKVATNAANIAAYLNGVVVLSKEGTISVTGWEIMNSNYNYDNTVISKDITMISSSAENVIALRSDGSFACYGKSPDSITNRFVPNR